MKIIHRHADKLSEEERYQTLVDTQRKCVVLLQRYQERSKASTEYRGR